MKMIAKIRYTDFQKRSHFVEIEHQQIPLQRALARAVMETCNGNTPAFKDH